MRTVHFNERVENLSLHDRIYTDTILSGERLMVQEFVFAGKLVPQISTINGILYYVKSEAAVMSRVPSKNRDGYRYLGSDQSEPELMLLD